MSLFPALSADDANVLRSFSLDIWNPFQDYPKWTHKLRLRVRICIGQRPYRLKETPEAHVFKAILRRRVKVSWEEGRVLQIIGERKQRARREERQVHRVERSSGKFLRPIQVPENAKVDEVKAAMENGCSTVTVPQEQRNGRGLVSVAERVEKEMKKLRGSGVLAEKKPEESKKGVRDFEKHPELETNREEEKKTINSPTLSSSSLL
ncbi:LOW QUALITY PROTEIN: Alpha crystallin/Hsp20 domain-containing protein [Cinnamomum micranthum f. kanehirae]|uniref:Alpha crystallin/Hsp20 domain-containing protein n=1 Tax=Cinnamomum micranthum f. kanehirae TaxID=337451 RepID=A0A3S4Q374_9MAGN|nr:LOW QUALITY PROTEIN: Alpha crystallin/Hsp20 domain-containing protein [Cinnamomum micranthum f. kanehirae]